MLMRLKRLRTRYLLNREPRVHIGKGTYLRNDFRWDIREQEIAEQAICIGENCIVGGAYIIENGGAKIEIGDSSTVGAGSMLVAADAGIIVGRNAIISFDVTIYTTNSHSFEIEERKLDAINTLNYLNGKSTGRKINWRKIVSKDVIIEDEAWIGFGATILKGVTIGKGAIVGARSVVTHDVEPYTCVAGNPAKTIKRLDKY